MSATRKAYILLCIEDSEPTIVELYDTLRDASAEFRRIIRGEPHFIEDEAGRYHHDCLPVMASARDEHGNLLLIVERSI